MVKIEAKLKKNKARPQAQEWKKEGILGSSEAVDTIGQFYLSNFYSLELLEAELFDQYWRNDKISPSREELKAYKKALTDFMDTMRQCDTETQERIAQREDKEEEVE